jgi:hypothetical protein
MWVVASSQWDRPPAISGGMNSAIPSPSPSSLAG